MNFNRTWLVLASFLGALVLWLAVQSASKPGEKPVICEVKMRNLARGLTWLNQDVGESVTLTFRGPQEYLDQLGDPKPYVDASKMSPGLTYDRPVLLERPEWYAARGITLVRQRLPIVLDRIVHPNRQVRVELVGNPDPNYIYEPSLNVIDPEQVTITGPSTLASQIKEARVTLDISAAKRDVPQYLDVELVSDKGQPLNGVFDIRPASVSVTPGLVPAPQARQGVLIEPQYDSTQPAFGYEVAGTEVHPSTVTITGPSAILAATTTVSTKPISLEGLASDATIPVQLDLPHGVRAVHAGTITVRVRIRRMKMKSPPSTAIEAPEPANPAP